MSLCQQFHGLLKKESKITTRSQHASRTFSYCDGEVVTDQELGGEVASKIQDLYIREEEVQIETEKKCNTN